MYSYDALVRDLRRFERAGLETGAIGKTVSGTDIPYVHVGGHSGGQAIVQAAIHAREHITAALTIGLIDDVLSDFPEELKTCGIYFVPMVNIDGVRLCAEGADFIGDPERRDFLIRTNGMRGGDFTLWKANLNAVDLNCNFPARWGAGVENVRAPAPESWPGPYPASEPETRALIRFSLKVRPRVTISYHCKGREIYWQFHQRGPALSRDRAVAEKLARATGYALIEGDRGSAGGYKDWCVARLGIPAFTIEAVSDDCPHPVPYSVLAGETARNRDVPRVVLDYIMEGF